MLIIKKTLVGFGGIFHLRDIFTLSSEFLSDFGLRMWPWRVNEISGSIDVKVVMDYVKCKGWGIVALRKGWGGVGITSLMFAMK